MFVKMLPRLHQTHLILVATLFLCLTCSFSVWAGHHAVIMVTAQAQPGTTEVEREKEPPTATKKSDPKKEIIAPVTPTQKNQPPSDKRRATTEVEKGQETPAATKKAGSQKEIIAPIKPTQKGQPPTVKKKAGARRTAPIDHSTMPPGQVIVKGHARTKDGKSLPGVTVTLEAPKPTPSDFVAGADPGWDKRKDVQSPPFDTSGDDGSFVVTLPGVPGMLPVSDVPVKDIIVTLDTTDQYIARLKRDTDPTKFVKDHGLEDGSRIISIPPDAGGGALVIYRVPTDQKEARSLQDAISQAPEVLDIEPDDCEEIQPNGRSEAYSLADSTVVAAKDCETMPVVEPVKERPCGAIAGNVYDTRPAARKRIVVYLAANCTRCVPDEARGSYQVTLTSGPGFDPSFLAIPAGSSIVLTSNEVKEIDHGPYVIPGFKEDREANRGTSDLGILSKGGKKTVLFSEPGEFMLADAIHKFEDMRVFVTPNACFAVVADDGTYKISEVPPGAYDIKVWTSPKRTHFPEVPVVVHRGKTTIQDLVLER